MDYQIRQVLTVCPDASQELIENDLKITGSVEETINRILDGTVSEYSESDVFHKSLDDVNQEGVLDVILGASTSSKRTDSRRGEQYSSDDDLPSIALTPASPSPGSPDTSVRRTGDVSDWGHRNEQGGGGSATDDDSPNSYRISGNLNYESGVHPSVADSKKAHCSQELTATNGVIPRSCPNRPEILAKGKVSSDHVKVADCSHGDYDRLNVGPINGETYPVDETDTLDLTEDNSFESKKVPREHPWLEISSSEEEHTIADISTTAEETTGNSKNSPNAKSSGNIMIDISSSDESEDELPLWKRVQLKRGQSPRKCPSDSSRTLTEKVPNQNVHAKNRVGSPLEFKSVGSQESQSSRIPSEYASSNLDEPLGKMSYEPLAEKSSVAPGKTCTSSDLSQASVKGVKRKKRSPEEIQQMREQAVEKRLQREKEKEEQTRLREEKKKEKQREAEHRKALREAHKALRPEECMKFLTVSVDQSLLEGPCGPHILQKLQELTCKVSVVPQPTEGAVTWCRQSAEHNLGEDIKLDSLKKTIHETEALVVTSIEAFVPLIHASLQSRLGHPVESERLNEHASQSIATLGGKAVTYIVYGAEQYFRSSKNRHQRNYRSAVLGDGPEKNAKKKGRRKKTAALDDLPNVSRVQMEEILIDLQLQHSCNVHFKEAPESVAEFIAMFTKAVAEKPFKKQRDKGTFSFHVNSEWAGGAKVAKDGRGLIKVWRQQLQQFRNVSPEIATAIISQYPSPQLLLKGYEGCSSTKDAELLLQDIVIRRGEGVLATSRRVGPELSRRVYKQMTSTDETMLL